MCGIFGYIGRRKKNLSSYIVDGLTKLEYRGYDSSGIAVYDKNEFKIVKKIGGIDSLRKQLKNKVLEGSVGIGHTRWATHGGVLDKNSHPHADCQNKIVVVHNGIIENYLELKKELIAKKHKFISDTDTEVFPHLIEETMKKKDITFTEAVYKSFNRLEGLNAVVALCDDQIVAFRKGSPLVVGQVDGGYVICSDLPTLTQLTSQIFTIDDGCGVVIKENSIVSILENGKSKKLKFSKFKNFGTHSDLGKYKHFMLKEIYEQPQAIKTITSIKNSEINEVVQIIKDAFGTYFTACGTAAYAGLTATYWFSLIAKKHVNFVVASEFPYFKHFLVPKSLLIVASQSGETMDTLLAISAAKSYKSKVLSLVNVDGSTITRVSDKSLLLNSGPERAVVTTKAFIAKLALFYLIANAYVSKLSTAKKLLTSISVKLVGELPNIENKVKLLAKKIKNHEHVYIIGRSLNYPVALEGALKLKEASYVHAEAFPAGELKHGFIAMIEKGSICIIIVANDDTRHEILSNAMELKARGAYIVGIGFQDEEVFDYYIKVPDAGLASPIVNVVPFQFLGYHLSVLKGLNPDKPRNLAKSVTVK